MTEQMKFAAGGIQFECQGSGKCCVSHNGYGHVFLNREDRLRMAEHLGLSLAQFTHRYCDQQDEVWKLKEGTSPDCPFLDGRRCGIYQARPTQCRTWPFWPEVMNAKTWDEDVASFCPGVGKGRVWTPKEIEVELRDQIRAEDDYGT